MIKRILKRFGQDKIKFTNKLAIDLFKRIDLIAYSSTGVVFEALQHGIPCICIEPLHRLNLCKFDPQSNLKNHRIFDIENTVDTLHNNGNIFDAAFREDMSIMSEFITPPNKQLWLKLIKDCMD